MTRSHFSILFQNAVRQEMRAANPTADYKELARQIGDRWKNLSDEAKRVSPPTTETFVYVLELCLLKSITLLRFSHFSPGRKQESWL
jgi:hypothetical protein